ncbi:MAG: LysR substrate-binding domain-containing protein [Candidatus Accumulibacter necessarius]|jgi:DNA-binding transcriptional LysR family regulator
MINFRLIRHLWLFLAVAEEQHFGRAAKRLGMSQPPLTDQIQTLEQVLKVKLFERSRRGTKLTPAGAAILPAIRKFSEQLERLELAVREATTGQRGMLTVGAITSAMVEVLPPLIERMRATHPDVAISMREIDSVEAVPLLQSGDIDLAFARLEGDLGSGIKSIPLREDRLAVALPRAHPLAARSRIRLALSVITRFDVLMFTYGDGLRGCSCSVQPWGSAPSPALAARQPPGMNKFCPATARKHRDPPRRQEAFAAEAGR